LGAGWALERLVQRQLAPDTALPLLLAAHEAQVEVLQNAVMAFVVRNIRGEGRCLSCSEELLDRHERAEQLEPVLLGIHGTLPSVDNVH
jgi:hypothetical protein